MKLTTVQKGDIACIKLELRASEKGAIVSRPASECRYDRIVDYDGKLHRVQIKYANGVPKSEGAVYVNLRHVIKKRLKSYTADEVDAVVVYIPKTDQVCWFDASVFTANKSGQMAIRYEPSKNGQKKGCLMAEDYVW